VMPSCFYAVDSYDPQRYWNGLFKGIILILCYTLTGPKTFVTGATKLGKCNARLMNILTVTPRLIAYAAVQARTMLSKTDWTWEDGNFDYTKFFSLIVSIFADEDLVDWSRETLAWLQSQVFGSLSGSSSGPTSNDDKDEDEDDITVQCRARHTSAVSGDSA
ncbi:hypothetical protein C8F01DRAFT_987671, partial [Mycena amicta]